MSDNVAKDKIKTATGILLSYKVPVDSIEVVLTLIMEAFVAKLEVALKKKTEELNEKISAIHVSAQPVAEQQVRGVKKWTADGLNLTPIKKDEKL